MSEPTSDESVEAASAATLSPCGLYRYDLHRQWGDLEQMNLCWVMLNPSTADATQDDATIRRCIAFSKAWGFGSLTVVNLFAYRATDPKALVEAHKAGVDVVGRENDWAIQMAVLGSEFTVAAWGAKGGFLRRDEQVLTVLAELGEPIDCLAVTKDGHPKHPLYVKGDTQLRRFNSPRTGASHKVEQPRAATVDIDPQDAATSLGELSHPAMDGAGLPATGASLVASQEAET